MYDRVAGRVAVRSSSPFFCLEAAPEGLQARPMVTGGALRRCGVTTPVVVLRPLKCSKNSGVVAHG
jgi:hypothetical protein